MAAASSSSIAGPPPPPGVEELRRTLLNKEEPVGKRNHAAYLLRTKGGARCREIIEEGLRLRPDSTLLRHELAYILGQMQDEGACATLEGVLEDQEDDVMVRHEAAEALGAIGAGRSEAVLRKHACDPAPEVAQTCELAIELLKWRREREASSSSSFSNALSQNPYQSVDPAPPSESDASVEDMRQVLVNPAATLFSRYRAMFGLRNASTEEAVLALCEALVREGEENSLFKHEIAYVLGQMEHPASVPALKRALEDETEHAMVRHEAAEALGAVGGHEVIKLLANWSTDKEEVVKQSCEVALNTADYWQNYHRGTEFVGSEQ